MKPYDDEKEGEEVEDNHNQTPQPTFFGRGLCLTYSLPLEKENPSLFVLFISVLFIPYHIIPYQDKESEEVYTITYSLPLEEENPTVFVLSISVLFIPYHTIPRERYTLCLA